MSDPMAPDPSNELVEHFFRHESANLIAVLTRAFGLGRIDLVEDMVSAAMLEAINAWKQKGVPDQPAAWIHRVAKNRILDTLRREKVHQRAMALAGQSDASTEALVDEWLESEQLPDSLLRMMFVCCHPSLDRQSQIALTLKVLCGFSNNEIARGLLLKPETVKKRVQRAKERLTELQLRMDLPTDGELQERLHVVHEVLYLMFNEGYSTSHGPDPIRDDICEEAARLCQMLCESQLASPATFALLALMLFHAARFESRIDDDGAAVTLEDQDRSNWNQDFIAIAERWLFRSGKEVTRYHLEAAIARQHCRAKSVATTDWPAIVTIYDRLIEGSTSPVLNLNRAIAKGQAGDISGAAAELDRIATEGELTNYVLLDCARARLYELSGDSAKAIACYEEAITKAAEHEVKLIERKIAKLRLLP